MKNFDGNIFEGAYSPEGLLGQLVGAASMCWENVDGAGTFESDHAEKLVKAAHNRLQILLSRKNILDGTEVFMALAGQLDSWGFPKDPMDQLRQLRTRMLIHPEEGEASEYAMAENVSDPVEIADGLADIIVVAFGTLLAYFGPHVAKMILNEVNRSNLDKVIGQGLPIKREDGKVLKPDGWYGPRIREILEQEGII